MTNLNAMKGSTRGTLSWAARLCARPRVRAAAPASAVWLAVVIGAFAQTANNPHGPVPTGGPKALAEYEVNREKHQDNPDKLVRPGLVADRKARTVEVRAESTGLKAGDTVEFLLVDSSSSHGYEAMLWSFAKPSDVHRALEFIGLKPGASVNPDALRFWPQGDRVILKVRTDREEAFRIEELVLDRRNGQTLPEDGFVFAGSMKAPAPDGGDEKVYAADHYDPKSVASIYNESTAVLDVPRQVNQGEAYGHQVVNPERALEGGTLLTVVMTPMPPEALPPRRDLKLSVERPAGAAESVFRLADANGVALAESPAPVATFQAILNTLKEDAEVYLTLSFGSDIPLSDAAQVCGPTAMLEMMGRVKVNPPAEGELFYRAFVPNRQWRTPAGRPTQPWELHLSREGGAIRGEMVWQETVWPEDGTFTPSYKRHAFAAPNPSAVRERLDDDARERKESGRRSLPNVLLVFAPADLTYGQLMDYVRPALKTHGIVHVFVEAPAQERPAAGSNVGRSGFERSDSPD